jgi:hypothetical protein
MPDRDRALREQLVRLLDWQGAHVNYEAALRGLPASHRGRQPEGLPYSPWQLVEHMRLSQWDILDFCRNPGYAQPRWPDDYWPATAAPPGDDAWAQSVAQFKTDLGALQDLVADPGTDLFAPILHGEGQTILREAVLVADHNAYHVGQLVVVRRLLGVWGPDDGLGA